MSGSCIGIVADDLTGGAAIAGEIVRPGKPVPVLRLQPDGRVERHTLIVETGSRYMPVAQAEQRVMLAVRQLRQAGFSLLMKKIDSTLKGNVAAELAAFARAIGERLVIVPACPAMKIEVRAGCQWQSGRRGVDVIALVAQALGRPPLSLPLAAVRAGEDAVRAWLGANRGQVIVADAQTQRDIQQIVNGARAAGINAFAGVYGLGSALAGLPGGPDMRPPARASRLLVLVGSTSSATVAQVDYLIGHGAANIALRVGSLFNTDGEPELSRIRQEIARATAPVLLVHTDAKNTADEVGRFCRARGWSDRDLAQALATPFAAAVRQLPDAGIFVVGGETTGALFDLQGWRGMRVTGEFSATVPIATLPGTGHPFILTKPGAFGAVSVLQDAAVTMLRRIDAVFPGVSS
ncbi:four-carbon acid sugar kinase family protein [Sodalis sp. RH21]|uniref:four-carbon acid sugar kinase family protein n=1 Tax=unclassified Sodalis (in: enterobacteria) TaxID=2636512 RepID=UPI0039B48569